MSKKETADWERIVQNDSLDLHLRVETWLKHTGYPLEYRAAEILRPHHFKCDHGFHVAGDEDRNGMEVDIVATYQKEGGQGAFILLCECKTIPAPRVWVAMEDPNPSNEQIVTGLGGSLRTLDHSNAHRDLFTAVQMPELRFAQTIRTMTANLPDEEESDKDKTTAYSAVTQLVRRSIATLRYIDTGFSVVPPAMVIPVLVVQGEIAIARWNSDTLSFSSEPAAQLWVCSGGHQGWLPLGFTYALVKVEALDAFARTMATFANDWTLATSKAVHRDRVARAKRVLPKTSVYYRPKPG